MALGGGQGDCVNIAGHSRRVVGGGRGKGRCQRNGGRVGVCQRQAAQCCVVRGSARNDHHVDLRRYPVLCSHHHLDQVFARSQRHGGRAGCGGRPVPFDELHRCPAVALGGSQGDCVNVAGHSRRVVGGGGGKGRCQCNGGRAAVCQHQAAQCCVVRGGARDIHHVDLRCYPVGRGHHHLDQIGADLQVVARLPGGAGVVCVYVDRGGACLACRGHCRQGPDAAGNRCRVYRRGGVKGGRQFDCRAFAVRQGEPTQRRVAVRVCFSPRDPHHVGFHGCSVRRSHHRLDQVFARIQAHRTAVRHIGAVHCEDQRPCPSLLRRRRGRNPVYAVGYRCRVVGHLLVKCRGQRQGRPIRIFKIECTQRGIIRGIGGCPGQHNHVDLRRVPVFCSHHCFDHILAIDQRICARGAAAARIGTNPHQRSAAVAQGSGRRH